MLRLAVVFGLLLMSLGWTQAQLLNNTGRPFVEVEVKIELENLNHVDDKTPGLLAEMVVVMTWNATFDPSTQSEFVPQVLFKNLDFSQRQPDISPRQSIFFGPDGRRQLNSRIVATFSQFFDFRDFPFDKQSVSIELEAEPNTQYILGEEETKIPEKLTIESFSPTKKYTHNFITTKEATFFERYATLSVYVMEIEIERENTAYVVTNIIPGIFAVMVSTSQVFLGMEKFFGVRVSISVWSLVLLSNLQSFPFSVIPRGSGVVYLEVFGLCNYILMIANFFELMVGAWLEHHGRPYVRRALDYSARWLLPCFLIIVNVALFIYYPGDSWRGLVIWTVLAFVFSMIGFAYVFATKVLPIYNEKHNTKEPA